MVSPAALEVLAGVVADAEELDDTTLTVVVAPEELQSMGAPKTLTQILATPKSALAPSPLPTVAVAATGCAEEVLDVLGTLDLVLLELLDVVAAATDREELEAAAELEVGERLRSPPS